MRLILDSEFVEILVHLNVAYAIFEDYSVVSLLQQSGSCRGDFLFNFTRPRAKINL